MIFHELINWMIDHEQGISSYEKLFDPFEFFLIVDVKERKCDESYMKIGDIYKRKENNSIIQIDSFAAPMGKIREGSFIIIFRKIENHNKFEIGSCPSFNGYGSQEEIEREYELLIPQEKLDEYENLDKVFELLKQGKQTDEKGNTFL